MTSTRPAWTIQPSDIRRGLKIASQRCYRLIGEARKNGNGPVVEAFTGVLDKIKEAERALRDARSLYGWKDEEGTSDA